MFDRPRLAYLAPNWMSGDVSISFDGAAIRASVGPRAGVAGRPDFDHALWLRLKAMSLDEQGAELTFAGRLARDNGWTDDFARCVIEEYLRFLYLAARAGHPVTPSDEVDQAWHLHMVYTRHYWGVLCGGVLGFRLEHGPTRGGAAEAAKYRDWYERTLTSYAQHFGEAAPLDVWPTPRDRFDPARMQVRAPVASRAAQAIPRRALLLLGVLAAASAAFGNGVFKQGAFALPMLFCAVALLVAYAVLEAHAKANANPRRESEKCGAAGGCGGCGGGCGGCGGCGG